MFALLIIYNSKDSMYLQVDYTATFARLKQYVRVYNESLRVKVSHAEYQKLSLKSTYTGTAMELIRFYGAHLQKQKERKIISKKFIICNTTLGIHKMQDRTTMCRHLNKLLETGIIQRRATCDLGNTKRVEIIINPNILVARTKYLDKETLEEVSLLLEEKTETEMEKILSHALSFKRFPSGYVALGDIKERDIDNNINMSTQNRWISLFKKNKSWKQGNRKTFSPLSRNTGNLAPGGPGAENPSAESTQAWLERMNDIASKNISINTGVMDTNIQLSLEDTTYREELSHYTAMAWSFARSVLYDNQYFSNDKIALTKKYIQEYFSSIDKEHFTSSVKSLYLQWQERILLAKKYVDRKPERFIPVPWTFFNKHFQYGFTGTRDWYMKMQAQRKSNKHFYQNLKEFCNQFNLLQKNPDIGTYRTIEASIKKKKDQSLLSLFYTCVSDRTKYNKEILHEYYFKT